MQDNRNGAQQESFTEHSALQRLYLMEVATLPIPPAGLPIPCYLLETRDGKHILIDSGIPADFVSPPGMPPAQHGKNVVEQLAMLGLQPASIDMLICTHLDVDHTGYHSQFTNAELILQRAEYEIACSGHPRFASTRQQWDHSALRYRLLDGDTELLPGLKVLKTSGHTSGHQSVLLQLPRMGKVLLAIDAILWQHSFRPDREKELLDEDEAEARASTIKLLEVAEHEHVALTVFGHDGQQWQTLKKLPAYYE
ncbi:N-acyl homoserine lactonase family protein [Ktedonosporobacter rubrisoli]|uniref:N-acyl homoserine lactonase family protein n=1 Tax=Ktedonosporobacter rubrisoli TaxID=2509675 RepID=A0A4P6JKW3_KTERU|nr:N-acyl homoserine lactonase family protein [Ktedonosporobacter rubrisoli]QBD75819.1 N-acyl homoserine lactonase family protein [Ktedonosporobacter rubrisoli]